jgi:hypothetical protein
VEVPVVETVTETVLVTETVVETEYIEDTQRIDELEEEVLKYQELIGSLDEYLGYVHRLECSNSNYENWGTGFSIEYKDKYYLLTAGHYVESLEGYGVFGNFRFLINDKWIYPKLLTYEVADIVPDYAIFYSDKITDGFNVDTNNTEPDYRLGIEPLIQENNNWGLDGECGSPIIDLDGEAIGLHVGYLQDIDIVLEAIDNMQ